MKVVDGFLPQPDKVRAHALACPFEDWPGFDGQVYKRVWIGEVPGLIDRLVQEVGPLELLGMGYRLNYAGELPNQAVHTDLGWGTHALVLYLCDGEGGTAFWRHKRTGATEMRPGDFDLAHAIGSDWDDAGAWEQVGLCPLAFNRAVIYPSHLFHSRWPFAAFGDSPETGRLIAVAFFTPRG